MKWSKSKIQVVQEQKTKDMPSNTCLNGSDSRTLDPCGWGPRFNAQWGNILLLDFFCFYVVKPLMPMLPLLPILCVCENLNCNHSRFLFPTQICQFCTILTLRGFKIFQQKLSFLQWELKNWTHDSNHQWFRRPMLKQFCRVINYDQLKIEFSVSVWVMGPKLSSSSANQLEYASLITWSPETGASANVYK